jgi:hypothetical protein
MKTLLKMFDELKTSISTSSERMEMININLENCILGATANRILHDTITNSQPNTRSQSIEKRLSMENTSFMEEDILCDTTNDENDTTNDENVDIEIHDE